MIFAMRNNFVVCFFLSNFTMMLTMLMMLMMLMSDVVDVDFDVTGKGCHKKRSRN